MEGPPKTPGDESILEFGNVLADNGVRVEFRSEVIRLLLCIWGRHGQAEVHQMLRSGNVRDKS